MTRKTTTIRPELSVMHRIPPKRAPAPSKKGITRRKPDPLPPKLMPYFMHSVEAGVDMYHPFDGVIAMYGDQILCRIDPGEGTMWVSGYADGDDAQDTPFDELDLTGIEIFVRTTL